MATPEDQAAPADPSAAGSTPASNEASPPTDAAKIEASTAAAADAPASEPPKIEPRALILSDRVFADTSTDREPAADASPVHAPRHWSIAAGLAFAIGIGAIVGAAATVGLTRDTTTTPQATAAANDSRALRDSLARLEGELAAVKTNISMGQRNSNAQVGKLTERLDRVEKAQAEPAAKLAKVAESLDRLERRIPAQAVAAAAPAATEVTGSIAVKQETKPPLAEGWRLLDIYAGRAVVESRNGRVFEVGPGSNLPGLGRVEAVKREDGKIMVVTRNGIIAGSLERRRSGRFLYDD